MTDAEWNDAQAWLAREASAEWKRQRAEHFRRKRSARTLRYNPPPWHRAAVAAIGNDDVEAFKAIRIGVTLGELNADGSVTAMGAL